MNSLYWRFAVVIAAASLIFARDQPARRTIRQRRSPRQPATAAEKACGSHAAAPTRPRKARSTWAGSTLPTRPLPGPSPWARPTCRTRSWGRTENRSRAANWRLTRPKKPKDAPPVARMFYVAYFKKDAKAEDRPITFFYNGGPGSSTVWLHMGSLGPKHVVTAGDTHLPAAPYKHGRQSLLAARCERPGVHRHARNRASGG